MERSVSSRIDTGARPRRYATAPGRLSASRLRDLTVKLLAAQEAERARIARDVHDGACQQAAGLCVDVNQLRRHVSRLSSSQIARRLGAIEAHAAALAEELRELSHGLHPATLEHVGLVAALQSHSREVERRHGVRVTLRTRGDVEPRTLTVSVSLFRILQELLSNACRHGRARHILVHVTRMGRSIALGVRDDGVGFDVGTATPGLGLVSIEERAREARGRVLIRSRHGAGTVVLVRFHDRRSG